MSADAPGPRIGYQNSLKLELQETVSYPAWVLGPEIYKNRNRFQPLSHPQPHDNNNLMKSKRKGMGNKSWKRLE